MNTESSSALSFEEFLKSKKIDPAEFRLGEEKLYDELEKLFNQVHPNSFVQQKLFLINRIRRKYTYEEDEAQIAKIPPKKMKPKFLPKRPKLS